MSMLARHQMEQMEQLEARSTMPTLSLQTLAHEQDAPYRCSRRTALGGALKLVAASGVLCGPLGSLAACASPVLPRKTPTPSPTQVRRITPENAPMLTAIATLQPRNGFLRGAAVSPEGGIIATGGRTDVQVWNARTGALRNTLAGHTEQIYSLAWSPASGLLASASFDGTVRVWDVERAQALQTLDSGSTASVFSVAWAPDGRQLACGLLDGRVLLWDVATATQRRALSGPAGQSHGGRYPYAVWGVAWAPDGNHVVSTRYDDLLLVWNPFTGESRVVPKTDSQPNTVAWAPDGQVFALTDDDGKVILYDGASAERRATFAGHIEGGWSYGLTWSPDSAMVASGRESGLVQVWEARTGRELALLRGHTDSVWALAWSPDGLRLVSTSDDGTARLWGVL
jgi:WD40 repeat protein